MDTIWNELYNAALAVQNARKISDYVTCGEVAAAILSSTGKIYTGVCIDTCSTLGICAERNAVFNMITNGENKISKVLAVMPDGSTGAPCGACRELMVQLMPEDYRDIEIMIHYKTGKIINIISYPQFNKKGGGSKFNLVKNTITENKQFKDYSYFSRYASFPLYYNRIDNKYIYFTAIQTNIIADCSYQNKYDLDAIIRLLYLLPNKLISFHLLTQIDLSSKNGLIIFQSALKTAPALIT